MATTPDAQRAELRAYAGGIAGGLVGVSVMALAFFAVDTVTGQPFGVFRALAELAGAGNDALAGFLLFVGAGALVWPLLFVTAGRYLPGPTEPVRGVVFALGLWAGFALAFGPRYTTGLWTFLLFSAFAHVLYGALLGFVKNGIAGPPPE